MKKIFGLILFLLPFLGVSQVTDIQTNTDINTVRISVLDPGKIATALQDLANSKASTVAYPTTGTNTYAITINAKINTYVTGLTLPVFFNIANTSTATLSVNGLSAKAIVKIISSPLASGDIPIGFKWVYYDGTNFRIDVPAPGGAGSVNSVSGTINRVNSTGGTDPVLDISSTFEALLVKKANNLSDLPGPSTALSNLGGQPLNSNLTTIAGLTPTTNNFIGASGSAWASLTPSQVKTALSITNSDVSGLGALATITPGTGVTTALGNSLNGANGLLSYNGLGTNWPSVLASSLGSGWAAALSATYSAGSGGNPFADNSAMFKSNADNTKTVSVNLSNITTGTNRIWTFPDVSGTFARNDAAQTFTGTQTFGSTIIGNISGNAATVTTNANLTGDVISSGNTTTYNNAVPTTKGGAGSLTGILKAASGVVSVATGSDIRNAGFSQVGSIFSESWANLTNWTSVGTPSAAVSGGQLHLNGTASTSTNYIKNNSYGKCNLDNFQVSWIETVGTIGASSNGISFALVSQNTLVSTLYANSMKVNIELSSTGTGAIKWYTGSGTTFTLQQTSAIKLVPVATDALNITLTFYPDKCKLSYNQNGAGETHSDTFIFYLGPYIGNYFGHNASAFAFFNEGGGSSHSIGAVTIKSLHNVNPDYLMIGNSIFSGYGNVNLYNRAITKLQKRTYSTFEVNALPSNSVVDVNVTEIAAYNAKNLILMPSSNDIKENGSTTALSNLATLVTALGGISNSAAPSGYSVANGNLFFCTELQRSGVAAIATYNTSLISTYGVSKVINFNPIGFDPSSTSMFSSAQAAGNLSYTWDSVHPNDYANGLMADEVISFLGLVKKDVYENEDTPLVNIVGPKSFNTIVNSSMGTSFIYSQNVNRERYLSFAGYGTTNVGAMTAAIQAAMNGTENVIIGQTTAGFGIWANTGTSGAYAATRRFLLDYSGNIATGSTASVVYRTTNAGSNVNASMIIDPSSSLTAGLAYTFDANGFGFTQGNGTRRIQGALIKPSGLTSTAGSEVMGLDFQTQTGGAAPATAMTLDGLGFLNFTSGKSMATATLDFPSTLTLTSSDLTITVTGASVGDGVILGAANASVNANSFYTAWISATNTVTVRFNNYSIGSIDPASGTFKVIVIK